MGKLHHLPAGSTIPDEILRVAKTEKVKTGSVAAIGGVDRLRLGYFNRRLKRYEEHTYEGFMEVTSLLGNITMKEGKPFLHVHGTFGRRDMKVIGGHVLSARVSPILELTLTPASNLAYRRFDDEIGLNVIFRTT